MDTSGYRTVIGSSVLLLAILNTIGAASPHGSNFDFDWRFCRGDFATAMMPAFNDSSWRMVNVPHDWSVEGPFRSEYASGTGYAPGGVGWYRKHFTLDVAHKDKLAVIMFDGVYHNSEVWINGQFVGRRP